MNYERRVRRVPPALQGIVSTAALAYGTAEVLDNVKPEPEPVVEPESGSAIEVADNVLDIVDAVDADPADALDIFDLF